MEKYWERDAVVAKLKDGREKMDKARIEQGKKNALIVDTILLGKTINSKERAILLYRLGMIDAIFQDLLNTPDAQERAIDRLGELSEYQRKQVLKYVNAAEGGTAKDRQRQWRSVVGVGVVVALVGVSLARSCQSQENEAPGVTSSVKDGKSTKPNNGGDTKMPMWEVGKD